jgi:hypothetical protein
MTQPGVDTRSHERRVPDEEIAAEPKMAPPELLPDATPSSMEEHHSQLAQPRAIPGIVENGLVRPLDPNVTLPEHARVIIVASDAP